MEWKAKQGTGLVIHIEKKGELKDTTNNDNIINVNEVQNQTLQGREQMDTNKRRKHISCKVVQAQTSNDGQET